jgi:hypothetical protein
MGLLSCGCGFLLAYLVIYLVYMTFKYCQLCMCFDALVLLILSWVYGCLLQMMFPSSMGGFGVVNLELGVCWKQCPSPSRVGFGVINLELGVCCKGSPSLSSRVGFGVVTLELGVCLTQCPSLRKNGLNVLCLELGVCWLQCWCLSRVSFGVLNHRSYLWCRFVCWTTCMFGTIYTYLTPLVLFSFQLAIRMYNTRKHMYAHKNPDTYPICFFKGKKSKGEEIF